MKPGLRQHVRPSGACANAQHVERLAVVGLRAHPAVQPRHRLHVVVEDVRPGVEHARDRVEVAAEIRRQHFDARLGQRAPHLAHGLGEVVRAAVRQVVAIHAGDHDVAQLHLARPCAATLAGSAGSSRMSCFAGEPLGTEQKPQPRVQRLPRIMKVAAPRWKHSWMFGQRADSQTVCRFSRRKSALEPVAAIRNACGPCAPTRAARGARGGRRSGPGNRSRYFFRNGFGSPAFSRSVLALPRARGVGVRAHQHAHRFVRPGARTPGSPCPSSASTTTSASGLLTAITCR